MYRERQQKTNLYFIETLGEEVREWCELNKIEVSVEAMLAYMVKHNLLDQSTINKYVAVNKYRELRDQARSKQDAVYTLSNLLPLEERQIWTLLGNHYKKFNPNKFKFP